MARRMIGSPLNIQLRILGTLTSNILSMAKEAWHIVNLKQSQIVLFCDYSDFEIPIGLTFYKIEDLNNKILYSGEIVLTNVTQQFMKPLDSVPQGWRTICNFKFSEESIPQVIKKIPEIKEWSEAEYFLIMKSFVA